MSTFTDINLLLTKHPVTGDIVKLSDEQAIKASIINLISTKNYERPFHPEIGCQIHSLLFENFNPSTASLIKQTIKDTIDKFEPRVTLTDVKVRDRSDENAIELEIYFIINSTDRLVKVVTAIDRVR